jgi:hypothetical protein
VLDTHALAWQPSPMAGVERPRPPQSGAMPRAAASRGTATAAVRRSWSEAGCTIWVKTPHLPSTQGPDGAEA